MSDHFGNTRSPGGLSRLPASMAAIAHDIAHAARKLRRSPGFTLLAVSILAVGMGATTAVFSLVSAVVLKPLPFEDPDRLVVLWEDFSSNGGPAGVNPSPADYVEWHERSRSFDDMAAMEVRTLNLTGAGEPERLTAIRTTANLFSLLGMQAVVGRTLVADDEGPQAEPAAVISESLWRQRFAADPGLVGSTITLDGLAHTVVGIVPSDFRFPNGDVSVWVPASFTPEELGRRTAYYLFVVARLADGAELGQARAEMSTIAETLGREHPESNSDVGTSVVALHEQMSRTARPTLLVLLAAVGTILLITCANVANLLLVRGTRRRKELALRRALGADHGRILRQLLTESAVLGVLGVAVGTLLAAASFGYLARMIPGAYPAGTLPGLDWRVLAFAAAMTSLTIVLFGVGPALVAARLNVIDSLKTGRTQIGGHRDDWLGKMLVVGEIGLTVVLLSAAGLLLRSYAAVLDVDSGFRPDNVLIAETALTPARYPDPDDRRTFYTRVLERVGALPGVTSAGYANYPPLVFKGGRALMAVEGQPPPTIDNISRYIVSDRIVSARYFSTLGVPLVAGRFFDSRDSAEAPPAVVINRSMATAHWGDEDPIGKRLKLGRPDSGGPWFTVVGVVGDMRQMGLDVPAEAEVYFNLDQPPSDSEFFWPRNLVVRTKGDPMAIAGAVREAVWEIDADQPVSNVRTMSRIFDAELDNRSLQLTLIGAFAAVALVLASVGLYGVLAHTIGRRTSEIGLRMALGAQRTGVVGAVLGNALTLAMIGIVVGVAAAVGVTRWLATFLFDVSPLDPATYAGVTVLLLAVTLLAAYVPARRASRVVPAVSLRSE